MRKLRNSENNGQDLLSNLKSGENLFSVPENYFTSLTRDILQRKNIIDSTQKALSIPENYHKELTDDILMRVREEELKQKVSKDGFSVPAQYFKQLESAILEKTSTKDTPIISLPKPRRLSWLKYASAASIALAISVFIFFQLTEREVEPTTAQVGNIIDEIPADEIISYLAFYSETGDYIKLSEELERLEEQSDDFEDSFSSEEIESYLENSI